LEYRVAADVQLGLGHESRGPRLRPDQGAGCWSEISGDRVVYAYETGW
jgi:hypothetical protein